MKKGTWKIFCGGCDMCNNRTWVTFYNKAPEHQSDSEGCKICVLLNSIWTEPSDASVC